MAPGLQRLSRKHQTRLTFAPVNPKPETRSSAARVQQKSGSSTSKTRPQTPSTDNETLEMAEPKLPSFRATVVTPNKETDGVTGSGSLPTPLKSSQTTPRPRRC